MIFNYPYTRNYYNSYSANDYSTSATAYKEDYSNFKRKKYNNYSYEISKKSPIINSEISDKSDNSQTSQSFQILGITLYFDDILLICLIFFLYTEGVEDQSLFISLVLLLLS